MSDEVVEQISKKPLSENKSVSATKDPKKVAAGKKLAEYNKKAKEALSRERKREEETRQEEEHTSASKSHAWMPELSFTTVLSIAGIGFTAFDMFMRYYKNRTAGLDKFDRVVVRLMRKDGIFHPLFDKNGQLNGKLPKTITDALGPPAEEVISANDGVISKGKERIKKLLTKRKTDTVNNREAIDSEIEEIKSEIDQ